VPVQTMVWRRGTRWSGSSIRFGHEGPRWCELHSSPRQNVVPEEFTRSLVPVDDQCDAAGADGAACLYRRCPSRFVGVARGHQPLVETIPADADLWAWWTSRAEGVSSSKGVSVHDQAARSAGDRLVLLGWWRSNARKGTVGHLCWCQVCTARKTAHFS
jgi:hypothetical protein